MPGLVISLVSLAIAFYFVDFRKLIEALQKANYIYISLGVVISLLWLFVRGMVWRTLLQEKASYKDVFYSINEGYLLNNVLPLRLGEVGRSFLLSRKARLGFWEVFSTIIIERALDVAFAAGLLLITLPFVVGAAWAKQAAIGTGSLVLVGLIVLYLVARNQALALHLFERLSNRIPILKRIAGNVLETFLSGLSILTNPARFLAAVFWVSVDWILGILQYYVLLKAFFPQATVLISVFCLGASSMGIAAPSSPGAVGVFELTIVAALSLFKFDASVSLAFAFVAHILNYLFTGIIGAYALTREGETLSGIYKSARGILSKEKQPE
ncbi:MAG: lysylphosphatidylglycerol synthase transmembrane domain-containing protein [Omnitrophica WOR_2 bacterium]